MVGKRSDIDEMIARNFATVDAIREDENVKITHLQHIMFNFLERGETAHAKKILASIGRIGMRRKGLYLKGGQENKGQNIHAE